MTDSFIFYASFAEAAGELDNEQYGALMRAINEYALFDKAPELTGVPKMLFTLIRPQLDANKKRRENGKYGSLGGRPQKESSGKQEENNNIIEEKPNGLSNGVQNKNPMGFENDGLGLPKNNPNVNDNVNVNDNDNVNVKGNENDLSEPLTGDSGVSPVEPQASSKRRFAKPTVGEIRAYCADRKNNIDAQYFWDYYEARGWKASGKTPMKDWQAAVRTWEQNGFSSTTRKYNAREPPIAQTDKEFDVDAMAALFNGR